MYIYIVYRSTVAIAGVYRAFSLWKSVMFQSGPQSMDVFVRLRMECDPIITQTPIELQRSGETPNITMFETKLQNLKSN